MSGRASATALLLASGLTIVHAGMRVAPETGAGIRLFLDHLFGILTAAAVLALCGAIGLRVLRAIGMAMDSAIEQVVFGIMLGAGTLATILLGWGAIAGYRGWALALLLAAVALVSRRELAAVPALAGGAVREWIASAGMAATVLMGAVTVALLLLAVAPPVDTDSLNYHLRIPAQFLERGRIFLPDDNLHVAWVGLAHLLYLPLLALHVPAGPAVLNAMLAVVLAASLAAAAARLSASRSAGRIAPVLLWGSPVIMLVATTPKIDVTLALFLFLGHYALLRAYLTAGAPREWMIVAGIGLGFGVGIKLLALPFILSVLPVAILAAWAQRGSRARLLAAFALAGIATSVPWLIKSWLLVGAPFYPELAAPLLPPWLEAIHGSRGLPSAIDPASLAPLRDVREPFNVVDWFVAPERLTPESEGRHYAANPLFALLILAIPLLRDRAIAVLLLPLAIYIAIALVLGSRVNLRYLLPVIPGLTLATALVTAGFVDRFRSPHLRNAVLLVACLVALYAPARAFERRLHQRPVLPHAAGLISRQDYRLTARDIEVAPYARITSRANALLPGGARVLLLFEPRGHGFAAPVLSDHLMTNWVLLEPALAPPRCLESAGITHILVGTGTLDYLVQRGLDPRTIHWDRFEAFAARCLALVEEQPEFTLYRVASPRR